MLITRFSLVCPIKSFKESARSCCITSWGHALLIIFSKENVKIETLRFGICAFTGALRANNREYKVRFEAL